MDQATLMIFAIAVLAAIGIGGVGFVFVGGETKSQQRVARVARNGKARLVPGENEVDNSDKRRKQVQDTLKDLEEKQKQ